MIADKWNLVQGNKTWESTLRELPAQIIFDQSAIYNLNIQIPVFEAVKCKIAAHDFKTIAWDYERLLKLKSIDQFEMKNTDDIAIEWKNCASGCSWSASALVNGMDYYMSIWISLNEEYFTFCTTGGFFRCGHAYFDCKSIDDAFSLAWRMLYMVSKFGDCRKGTIGEYILLKKSIRFSQ